MQFKSAYCRLFASAMLLMSAALLLCADEVQLGELTEEIRKARLALPQIAGVVDVTASYFGIRAPNLNNSMERSLAIEGKYKWWLKGNEWQLVKLTVSNSSQGLRSRSHVVRSYEDSALAYEVFDAEGREEYPAYGRKSINDPSMLASPMVGRKYGQFNLDEFISGLESPTIESKTGKEGREFWVRGYRSVDSGPLRSIPIEICILPDRGYLASVLTEGDSRGMNRVFIESFEQVG